MKILAIRTGLVRAHAGHQPWTSAIVKERGDGPFVIGPAGIVGDEHADLINHGGADKAILCYARDHYAHWVSLYGAAAPAEGTLGENLEVTEANEDSVCVGDIYTAGELRVQVSQPRQPCWKPATLHALPDLTARILKSGRTGWYLRVLAGGSLGAPVDLALTERPNPEWTVSRATRVLHFDRDPALRAGLASLPELSAAWRDELR